MGWKIIVLYIENMLETTCVIILIWLTMHCGEKITRPSDKQLH